MAHAILSTRPQATQKRFAIKLPKIQGKYGFSLNLGQKAFFIGVAVADIEVETITKKRRYKIFSPSTEKTKSKFVAI